MAWTLVRRMAIFHLARPFCHWADRRQKRKLEHSRFGTVTSRLPHSDPLPNFRVSLH
jgi:hypothetical protein